MSWLVRVTFEFFRFRLVDMGLLGRLERATPRRSRDRREGDLPRANDEARVLSAPVPRRIAKLSTDHASLVADVVALIEAGRAAARSINMAMTATYWHVGRLIVEREQRGARRAEYGTALLERLAEALTARYGRGYSRRNVEQMRTFYLSWPNPQTPSAILPGRKPQTASALSVPPSFPLPWSDDSAQAARRR